MRRSQVSNIDQRLNHSWHKLCKVSFHKQFHKGEKMFSRKIAAVLFMFAISFTALSASAGQWDRGNRRPVPNYPGYGSATWQYDGQRSGPINGSPWGVDYCGTEYPQYCSYRGSLCYVNNGYWWDNINKVNWFNVYRCR